MNLESYLSDFQILNNFNGKGPLCVALVITRHAKESGLPLNPDNLLTKSNGQVLGLGKGAVQKILKDYGITKVLAEEGGRTSRGSVGNMRNYVYFLNSLFEKQLIDLPKIEKWWIGRIEEFFKSKPFLLNFDKSKSIRSVIRDLLEQAEKRQSKSPGATIVGTMLQHLVGAKLHLLVGDAVKHFGASVADNQSKRTGDFIIEDVCIHVTTSPSEALIRKCLNNINNGLKPVIITYHRGAITAEELSIQLDIKDRLDIFEAEQFLAGNLYEIGKFNEKGRYTTTEQLIKAYNQIISECESDPSLRIETNNGLI